jgi:RNA polymerase sigma-70 factor (ECF subfamily)
MEAGLRGLHSAALDWWLRECLRIGRVQAMPESESESKLGVPQGSEFPTTHWSVVVRAGDPSSTLACEAVEKLCCVYWYPLYGFVRRQGRGPEEAQDLTQEFFAQILEKEAFKRADRERGRFRTFLLAALKNFLVSEWRKGQAARRNCGPMISLDLEAAEQRYQTESSDPLSPDKIFEKRWAAALLEQVLCRLGEEYAAQGKQPLFERLKALLWGGQDAGTYADAALQLGMSEGALRVAAHRLRHRYLETLRAQVADTLDDPADVDDELRYLIQLMGE